MIWLQWMHHIGEKGLHDIHNKGIIEGHPNFSIEVNFCEHCVYGKQNHVRFPSGPTRTKGIMELIHSDVFGPVLVP